MGTGEASGWACRVDFTNLRHTACTRMLEAGNLSLS
jgi:hypothetical protein